MLCENCQKSLEPERQTETVEQTETVPEAVVIPPRSRGRPKMFETVQERKDRKSEYNRRYYNKKMAIKKST
jgi:hypothetical protein